MKIVRNVTRVVGFIVGIVGIALWFDIPMQFAFPVHHPHPWVLWAWLCITLAVLSYAFLTHLQQSVITEGIDDAPQEPAARGHRSLDEQPETRLERSRRSLAG